MRTLSVSEAKMKLSGLIDTINATDEEIVITRKGRPAAVLVSPEEFERWKETLAVHCDQGDNFVGPDPRSGLQTVRSGTAPYIYVNLFISFELVVPISKEQKYGQS
jgi:prevent-host-death family protein